MWKTATVIVPHFTRSSMPSSARRYSVSESSTIPESLGILGLFTSFEGVGGIEASGRLAWEALKKGNCPRRFLLSHRQASSKIATLKEATQRKWPVQAVIVWHLGLLKLLPFLRLENHKLILFLHGVEAWKRHGAFSKYLLRRVDLFLSNTAYTWDAFISANPDFRNAAHQTVHLGIGTPCDRTAPPSLDSPVALMIGRMSRSESYKGHAEVIRAWPSVLERIPMAKLWIVGPGDLTADLKRLANDLGIASAVKFFGTVSEEQKIQLLLSASCLALPSRGEGFGLVYLEAMRLGRPCLVSTFDAGREVVQPPRAGLAVNPENVPEVACALIRLLTPGPEWNVWSAQSREHFEANFTAESFQSRFARVFESL
jgi:glycosyltransferase involved in cell wall biosynthesis